jgi:hypothetical protein
MEAIERAAMLTPIVTELPVHLEPAGADSFLEPGADLPRPGLTRELDRRRSDGIDVRLLWNQRDGSVTLAVSDSKTGDAFSIEIEPSDALEAFQHPYSYAAFTREHTLAA